MTRGTNMKKVERALVSVSNKEGIAEFARELQGMGVEILSTGGTARLLREAGIRVKLVSEVTGFPEILEGRVKTLHPMIHGGLLGKRSDERHLQEMAAHGIRPIDIVVVNLYPFEETVSRAGVSLEEAIENIDIGGPSMLRSAAKNFEDVVVVVDPADYGLVLTELKEGDRRVSANTRATLARKAFQYTARYDAAISSYLSRVAAEDGDKFPRLLTLSFEKVHDLRYGENPHQKAAFYRQALVPVSSLAAARKLHGKELSFNNLLDLEAALSMVREFERPAAAIIKHTNPCGVAVAETLVEAYRKARECDPVSAFGGIVATNRVLDAATAGEIASTFMEAVIAPGFAEDGLSVLTRKKDLRLMECALQEGQVRSEFDLKRISGGLLVQDKDTALLGEAGMKVVSKRQPTPAEIEALGFAWRVAKHVKSNAIVFTTADRTVGIGAGQMSRVDSVKIAAMKAGSSLRGTVVASDAFFPFRDGVDAAAEAGATAVIQPGGSVRDEEVIEAADEHGMAMVFTGMRHFRH